jgi:hypothetical protein
VLGGLAALAAVAAPGGLAGLVRTMAGRLAPAPVAVPALASVSAGFTGMRDDARPGDFDLFGPGDPGASDPDADDDPFAGAPPDDPFPEDPFGPGGPFHLGGGDGDGGDGDGDGREGGRA